MAKEVFKKSEGTKEHGYIMADYIFFCPGCECLHGVWTTNRNGNNAMWEFNGDLQKPTVSPSLHVKWVRNKGEPISCHSFVKEGKIQFLTDCTHKLAGQIIDLTDF